MSAVRVALITKGLGLGGAETLLTLQVEQADAEVVTYDVVTLRPDKTHFISRIEAAGARVHPIGADPRWPARLASTLGELQPDLVHSHSPLPAVAARAWCRRPGRGVPHLYTEHNRWDSYRAPTRLANAATMPLDSWIWAVSAEAASSVTSRLQRRVETLEHGVDVAGIRAARPGPAERAARRAEVGLGPDDIVFLNVANRRPAKAHEVLLDAFGRMHAQEDRARLVLVGQQLDTPEFRALVAASPAARAIRVLGVRLDAVMLMAAADALIMSSDHEGLPVSVMEALAVGLPVVATAVGGVPEAVRDGVEGRLVAPRQPAALAAAALELVDEGARRRLSEAAVARSAAFDVRRAVGVVQDRYRALG